MSHFEHVHVCWNCQEIRNNYLQYVILLSFLAILLRCWIDTSSSMLYLAVIIMILLVFVHHAYNDDNDGRHYDCSQDTEHHSRSHTQPVRRGRMIGLLCFTARNWVMIYCSICPISSCMKWTLVSLNGLSCTPLEFQFVLSLQTETTDKQQQQQHHNLFLVTIIIFSDLILSSVGDISWLDMPYYWYVYMAAYACRREEVHSTFPNVLFCSKI